MAAIKGHTVNTSATAHLLSQLIQVVWMCVWDAREQAVQSSLLALQDSGYKLEN